MFENLFNLYLKQFEENSKKDRWFTVNDKALSDYYGHGTYYWFKGMAEKYFGGGYLWYYKKEGIDPHELREAMNAGLVKYKYYSNWQARQLGNTDWYALTTKGLKELYKYYLAKEDE
jgi:hypothetical protein